MPGPTGIDKLYHNKREQKPKESVLFTHCNDREKPERPTSQYDNVVPINSCTKLQAAALGKNFPKQILNISVRELKATAHPNHHNLLLEL